MVPITLKYERLFWCVELTIEKLVIEGLATYPLCWLGWGLVSPLLFIIVNIGAIPNPYTEK